MTQLVPRTSDRPSSLPPQRRDRVAHVADNFFRLLRAANKARARFISAAGSDTERSAHFILRVLQTEGPMRAGAVAESLHSDPSTVSRQVAALIKDGLLERQADPVDGRASLLTLTEKADTVLAGHDERRTEHFAALLADWTDEELDAFAHALGRFQQGYVPHATWLATRSLDEHGAPVATSDQESDRP